MSQRITIDPVTRIEGHSKITVQLDEAGKIVDAHFHVTQFRGFEKFCEGRPFTEMPSLMARICGICPVSHLIASSKACDALHLPALRQPLRQSAEHLRQHREIVHEVRREPLPLIERRRRLQKLSRASGK